MAANASELFHEMLSDIELDHRVRVTEDPTSPGQGELIEARNGRQYTLWSPEYNIPDCKSVDMKWATANTLHFFCGTERAAPLLLYNKLASRFLTDGDWKGAYGAAAMPQIYACIVHLRKYPSSRRAVVSMPGLSFNVDVNNPPCWNTLHFMACAGVLEMQVYQRSLHLFNVMPYDCIVLSNILIFVARKVGIPVGPLRWTVGSLHRKKEDKTDSGIRSRHTGLVLPTELLDNTGDCWSMLESPGDYSHYLFSAYLTQAGEVRT